MLSQPAEDFAIAAFLRSIGWGWKWPRTNLRPEGTVDGHTQLQEEGALGTPPALCLVFSCSQAPTQ